MITEMQSKGLYSTWMFLPEINTLFDCGEGVASHLKKRVFGIQQLIISHDHTDHISGLDTLINVRNLGGGDQNIPLTIYHPKKIPNLKELKHYIRKTQPNLKFEIQWKEISPGQEIPIGKNKKIRAFQVEHGRADALGFAILESRARLKEKYRHLGEVELTRMNRDGVKLHEDYDKKVLVYSGDAWKVPLDEVIGADYLYLDCTFLKPEDRNDKSEEEQQEPDDPTARRSNLPTHANLDEALEFIKKARIAKKSFLHHVSPRYGIEDIQEAQKQLPENCRIIPPGSIFKVNPHTNPSKAPQRKKQKPNPRKRSKEHGMEP